ncbi:MAG: hypothetical protein AAFU56_00460 [Pseudomonadota bacterium]
MSLNLTGLPAGAATVEVSQGGTTVQTSTTTLPGPLTSPPGPTKYLGFAKDVRWSGVTASVVDGGNGADWTASTHPAIYVTTNIAAGGSGDRILVDFTDSELSAGAFIGARADVYRISNGVFSLLRSSNVVDGNISQKHSIGANQNTGYTDAGFSFRIASFSRPDSPYYFGVAAVDAGGQIGTVGWAAGYTPGNVGTGQGDEQTNTNTVDLGQPYTEGGPLSAPASVTVTADASGPAAVHIAWDPVVDAIAYIPFVAYADPTTLPVQSFIDLESDGGPAVQTGDMVTFMHRVMSPHVDMMSPRVYKVGSIWALLEPSREAGVFMNTGINYTYGFHDFDESTDPAPDPRVGSSYIRFDVNANVGSATPMSQFWHSTAQQSFYSVLDQSKTYRFSVWIRANRATQANFTFNFNGLVYEPPISVTTSWQQITVEGSPTSDNTTGPRDWKLQVSTSGESSLQIDFAGLEMYEVGTQFSRYLPFRRSLIAPGMFLRDHTLIKDRPKASDTIALTNPPGATSRETTMETILYNCLDTGALPWLQIEWYHRPEDWADLMAYLGAPVSSGHPMALKRQAQGMSTPWTEVFPEILFEVGNETWNPLSDFRAPPPMVDAVTATTYGIGEVYGYLARQAADAMEGSPYWSPKIKWILGGRSEQPYGLDAARVFQRPVRVGIANYNGGWDVGTNLVSENDSSYQAIMGVVPASTGPSMDDQISRAISLAEEASSPYIYGENLRVTCYEAGPGYQLNGLNGVTLQPVDSIFQEVVMKSRAAATGTLDTFCAQADKGFSEGNFFVLGAGNNWTAQAPESQGGGTFPTYQVLAEMQKAIAPARALEVRTINEEPLTVVDNTGYPVEADAIFTYAFENIADPSRKLVVVGNRSQTQTHKPTILTWFSEAEACQVWSNTGDYREHNRYAPGNRLANPILVDGEGQSGTTLSIRDTSFDPSVDDTFTIDGDATTYTVTDVTGFEKPAGSLLIAPALASTPGDGASITWSSVVDGLAPDPLCVPISITPTTVALPSDLTRFEIDDTLGATAAGLPPGSCVMILFEGVK